MKTLKVFLIPMLLVCFTYSTYAHNIPYKPTKSEQLLKEEIVEEIKKIDLSDVDVKDNTVRIQFVINDAFELVVLKTDHKQLDSRIKGALNYHKISIGELSRNSLYSINIKLVS